MTATVSPFPMLGDLRQVASDRFDALGFPTTRNEEWKYTNLAPFLKTLDAEPGPFAPEELAAAPSRTWVVRGWSSSMGATRRCSRHRRLE